MSNALTPYANLSPDCVLDAIADTGLEPDGRLLALNSFENRVYQIGLDDGEFVIAKFYRPNRWTDAAILEEHQFAQELLDAELPMVAAQAINGKTLHTFKTYRYAIFPRRGGRAPELEGLQVAEWMGRMLARIHNIGALKPFRHRAVMDVENLIEHPAAAVLQSRLLPAQLDSRYRQVTDNIASAVRAFAKANPVAHLRLHGDCHPGNVLWTDHGPHFVDLDDCRSGPAVQDLWMLMSGDIAQQNALLEGYQTFRDFNYTELNWIPVLRIMRQVHHAGWIASRWDDPAFPMHFAFAGENRWWEEHLQDLISANEILDDLG